MGVLLKLDSSEHEFTLLPLALDGIVCIALLIMALISPPIPILVKRLQGLSDFFRSDTYRALTATA